MRLAPAALSLLLGAGAATGCKRPDDHGTSAKPTRAKAAVSERAPAGSGAAPLAVARVHEALKLDGELSEPPWNAIAARTPPFTDAAGDPARPYSEARFLWDADNLYLGLYAGDDDIRATVTVHDGPVWIDDAFSLHLAPEAQPDGAPAPTYAFDISATGVVTDAKRVPGGKDDVSWESGIKLGVDRDGILNDATAYDEEWVIEAAIPWRSLGIDPRPGTRVLVDIGRCDTPRGTKEKRCGAWGTPKARRVLVLSP